MIKVRAWKLTGVVETYAPLFLFVIAFLPRLLALDAFLTPDEFLWVGRSREFLVGLLTRDWSATLQTGHPGVTTMWTGSLAILYKYLTRPSSAPSDLLNFVRQVPNEPVDLHYIAALRFPTVLLASLTVVAFYWLVARLLNQRTALVAACLFALNPFYIAHSRLLHHDALATTFMILSLLPMIGYWLGGWGRGWLLASGAMAGLAFLSKSSGLFLMPFSTMLGVGACVLGWRRGERIGWAAIRRVILDGALWGAMACLTYALLWPAMWVKPITALATVASMAEIHASEGHVLGHYFLGKYTDNPGVLFYPLLWLLRATPLNLLGLGALLILASRRSPSRASDSQQPIVYACLAFILAYALMMTLGAKKQDRYILPIFPVLDLLAGLGLVSLWHVIGRLRREASRAKPWAASWWPKAGSITQSQPGYWLLAVGVVLVQAIFSLPYHPYYLTYYNPLLGGGRTADRLVTMGWGEGLDLAAAYLNRKPDADHLKVAAWYYSAFAPYFRGQTTHFSTIGEPMSSDFLVIYRNQVQRQRPDPNFLVYYQRHYTPEYTVHLKGVDYALVYAVPIEHRTHWESTRMPGKLTLYGYRQVSPQPDSLTIRLLWENRGASQADGLWAALQRFAGDGLAAPSEALVWQPCRLAPGFAPAEAHKLDALVESDCKLYTGNLEPGAYSLHVGVGGSPDSQGVENSGTREDVTDLTAPRGELGVSLSDAGTSVLITPREALDAALKEVLPPDALPLHSSYGDMVALIGYAMPPSSPEVDHTATIRLYWRALQDLPQPAKLAQGFQVRFDFIAPDGTLIAGTDDQLFGQVTSGAAWQVGEVLVDPHVVPVPDDLPAGDYRLAIALIRTDTRDLVPVMDMVTGLVTTDYVQLGTSLAVP